MRSQPATTTPVAQRFFWGSVVALGVCLGASGCHSDQPAQSPADMNDETAPSNAKWSGAPSKPADPNEPEAKKGQFDQEQANVVMARAAKKAHECTEVAAKGDYQSEAEVTVVFSGIGRSTKATLGGELDQKQVGQCVIRAFVGIIIPPFEGPDMEMKYAVDLKPDAKVPKSGEKVKPPPKGPPKASK
jgi:hypothetical protein